MIVYKVYPYSIWATLCSIVSALIAAFLIILGIKFFTYNEAELPLAIVSVVAGLAIFIIFSRIIPNKISAWDVKRKLQTKPKFCATSVNANPGEYEAVCAINEDFKHDYAYSEIKRKYILKSKMDE